jgi:HSP20 family protein
MPRRPDPLKELLDLQERMNRFFEETLSRDRTNEMEPFAPSWVPIADVYDSPETYLVELELPGLARTDIDLRVKGREVTVRGERHPAGGHSAAFHRLERRYGAFGRTFRFDADIDAKQVKAEIKEGLLTLTVPKAKARRTKRVVKVTRRG